LIETTHLKYNILLPFHMVLRTLEFCPKQYLQEILSTTENKTLSNNRYELELLQCKPTFLWWAF